MPTADVVFTVAMVLGVISGIGLVINELLAFFKYNYRGFPWGFTRRYERIVYCTLATIIIAIIMSAAAMVFMF